METKQTAVEWLVTELNQKVDFIPMDKWDEIRELVQQAKQMEKEQIVNAWKDAEGYNDTDSTKHAENYYNKTYGN